MLLLKPLRNPIRSGHSQKHPHNTIATLHSWPHSVQHRSSGCTIYRTGEQQRSAADANVCPSIHSPPQLATYDCI